MATRIARDEVARRSSHRDDDLTRMAARRDISDRAFRVYTIVSHRFGAAEFTAEQAARAAGLTVQQVGRTLGELRAAGLYTNQRRVVGYTPAGGRVWRTFNRRISEVTPQ